MVKYKTIAVGKKRIEAIQMNLSAKNLIVLRGRKGYIMCGYLNVRTAEKLNDAAVMITGISTIREALRASVFSCTSKARGMGIYKGQPVKDCLSIIA